ncbi:unnamed protein product [Oppiella nova]|uniref:Uncharacterized protein n=1 Tax=Oppiella nova TaxID=334625 RepID=A0A7R9QJN1_9ACAR|nr:unnamed protein product [Oppiella nova]CAG2167276.1 unnamed protein product [Oppiella nova]
MSLAYNFSGKVALVTGSSSGIGAATAILFAKSGANVVVTGRNATKVSEVAKQCLNHWKWWQTLTNVVVTGRNATKVSEVAKQCLNVSPKGLKALEVVADVTRDEDLIRLVDTTVQTFGKIDILVNNAGIAIPVGIGDKNYVNIYRQNLQTNLDSVVFLTHICVKHLEKTKGNIVNISSVRSTQTRHDLSAYCMSKSALDMFTKCIAVELGHKGIRVNSVNPGAVKTNFASNSGVTKSESDKWYENYGKLYPVGRVGEGDDIANAVLYLASNESSFITGSVLVADGGHLAANINITQH